jgi:thiol-disulfide isomerase/thioredoxin
MAEQPAFGRNWLRWGALAAVAVAAVAIYVSLDAQSNTADAACAAATGRAAELDGLAVGQVAAFRVAGEPVSMAAIAFQTPEGDPITLRDFSGRLILLNIWATWCVPCREEMPALDALNTYYRGEEFEVVPVSLDTTNTPDGPIAFYADYGIESLGLYVDPSARLTNELRTRGITPGFPTSILLDEEGCMLGILQGPADWAGPDALALIGAAIGG